jgi:transcriptional regulator with XRE-family HTH domain
MKREELVHYRISSLINTEANYTFPEFLRALRRIQGLSRAQVGEELGVKGDRLWYLESGKFRRDLERDELLLLADYFQVPATMLEYKAQAFVREKAPEKGGN